MSWISCSLRISSQEAKILKSRTDYQCAIYRLLAAKVSLLFHENYPVGLGLLVGDEIHTISVFAAKFTFRKLGVV